MTSWPGNKSGWHVSRGPFSQVYDLFLGAGGWSHAARKTNYEAIFIGAEVCPIQRAILRGEANKYQQSIYEIALKLKASLDPRWDGRGKYGELFPKGREKLGDLWNEYVKTPWDEANRSGVVTKGAVVAQILVGSYAYGGNVRTSGNGLNSPPNAHKIFAQTPVLPPVIPGLLLRESFEQVEIIDGKKSIVLIDPPYVLPTAMRSTHQKLTSCYPGHMPYGEETWRLYEKALGMSIKAQASEIRVANYWSERMDDLIQGVAKAGRYHWRGVKKLPLQKQAKKRHQLKHGRRSVDDSLPKPVECEWILAKNASRLPVIYTQPSLLEVAA